jgi:hypothetical protein
MGHLLKIKCVDSRGNVHIVTSKNVPFTLTTVYCAKFSPNSHETEYSVHCNRVILSMNIQQGGQNGAIALYISQEHRVQFIFY